MKAQVHNDGSITLHGSVPKVVIDKQGRPVLGVSSMTKAKQQVLGIYEVVTPELGEWEELGELYIDKTKKMATYRVVAKSKPSLEEAANLKRNEMASIERNMRVKLAENSIDAILDGDAAAAQALLSTLRGAKQATLAKIQGHVDANELDELLAYNLNSPQTAALLAAIENLKA